jgi:hypothetical protein
MPSDRRRNPRLVVDSPVVVSLGKSKAGILFDVGETGLSIHGFVRKSQGKFTKVAFHLPQADELIEAKAKIVWISESENRTGMRFVEVPVNSQQQLRQWVDARHYPGFADLETRAPGPTAVGDEQDLPVSSLQENVVSRPLQVVRQSKRVKSPGRSGTSTGRRNKPPTPFRLCLLAAILSPAIVLGGYHLPNLVERLRMRNVGSASEIAQPFSNGPMTLINSRTESAVLPSRLPVDQPGFVLQVAAMKYEEHADALAVALNRIDFAAFVFRRDTDRFYRVAVGPYGDVVSLAQVKDELEKRNFMSILRRWSPE